MYVCMYLNVLQLDTYVCVSYCKEKHTYVFTACVCMYSTYMCICSRKTQLLLTTVTHVYIYRMLLCTVCQSCVFTLIHLHMCMLMYMFIVLHGTYVVPLCRALALCSSPSSLQPTAGMDTD